MKTIITFVETSIRRLESMPSRLRKNELIEGKLKGYRFAKDFIKEVPFSSLDYFAEELETKGDSIAANSDLPDLSDLSLLDTGELKAYDEILTKLGR